ASAERADYCFLPYGILRRDAACCLSPHSCIFLGGLQRARRRPAGIHVREIQGVELRPENVALRAHSGVCFILFFAMPAGGDEIHIGLHRKARGRKDSVTAQREIARKAGRFDDFQPSFDPAWLCAVAVVIGNPLAPGKSERRIFSARENRSEEHTSELQSPYDLVCRLLLEKKKA